MGEFEITLPEIRTDGSLPSMQLPEISDYNFWQLYTNRMIALDDEITTWDYHIVKDILAINMADSGKPIEERKPIIILVNSNGGLLDVTNSIIDTVQLSKTPVWTVNMGSALSGGCLIFLSGERRLTMSNSWCMAHAGSGGLQGNYNEAKEQSKVWDEQVKKMGEYIMTRTGLDEKTWKKYKNKDWWLNANQQLEFGFATEMLESLDSIWAG